MGKKILIVDDEPEQIEFATILLEQSDYIPISASNGREGIEKAKAEKPDLILLDIMMPEKSGIGMYHELKSGEETKHIPVIIVTGVTQGEKFKENMMTKGQDIPAPEGYIEKPMNPDTVIRLVNELLS